MGWFTKLLTSDPGKESANRAAGPPAGEAPARPPTPLELHRAANSVPLPLPPLAPEWQDFADRLRQAMLDVEAEDASIYLIFQPDHNEDRHVGLGHHEDELGPGWNAYSFGVALPEEWTPHYFDGGEGLREPWAEAVPDIAHAEALLCTLLYPGPGQVRAELVAGWDTPSPGLTARVLSSLTGDDSATCRRGSRPQPRLIRTPRDAELSAAEWVRWLGSTNVGVTPAGADEGIDVYSDQVIAQVKMEGVPTGRPVVQNAHGVAAAEGKTAMVFSLGGYKDTAVVWADKTGVPLFQFDLQGTPEPANAAARALLADP